MSINPADQRRPAVRYLVAAALLGFVLGAFVVASLGTGSGAGGRVDSGTARSTRAAEDAPIASVEAAASTSGRSPVIPRTAPEAKDLAARHLTIPVQGIAPEKLVRSYHDERSGDRQHEAIDILAPKGTPVVAVEDGTIAKLFYSKAGGITVYQFDPGKEYSYYYAHLDRYADGMTDGAQVRRGQVLGYVGTSGNAPKDTPHLHFAVFRLTPEKQWWQGTAIDPFDVLR
jgi:murein DD-endopeptidase MepM/ murein hydrolase activator NlpD